VHKRRTRNNVETLRSAEASLDAFWQAADDHFRSRTGETPHAVVADFLQERTLQRTPPWEEPEEDLSSTRRPSNVEYIYVPFSNALHDRTKQITGVFKRLDFTSNSKAKTHGLSNRTHELYHEEEDEDTTEDKQPTFKVDKRAHKVFRTLFYSPLCRDQPGEIPWANFLHAMAKTSFSVQKLQGSAWQFTPHTLDVEQPIQFHEPHPNPKLPFTWARRNGRRLARMYGWRGDLFRLA